MSGTVLVIDDERGIRSLCGDVLRRWGAEVETAATGEQGLELAAKRRFDLVLCDISLPGIDGLSVLESLLADDDPPTVILITAFPSVATAVRGMKAGARDYLTKPFTPDELRMVAERALGEDQLRRENQMLRQALSDGQLIGVSSAMVALRATIDKVARATATVLITGESGTGKELVARAVHYQGDRAARPFVALNCGAAVGPLLESELFGHVRGAFTGADRAKPGLFVTADRGTLFLDEIGELPLEVQPVLLRVLQDGELKPVGGVDPVTVDTRVIAATNRNLDELVKDGRFREDLYYRLNVLVLEVPPLRERREDIAPLAVHFAARAAERAGHARPELSDDALQWLTEQDWPGNVRELENAVERAVVLASGPQLARADFASRVTAVSAGPAGGEEELLALDELERRHILRVLDACDGQKTRASAILGINRTTLWKKLRQYGVE